MIAEIYGKISSTGSNLAERLEDELTGNVFGALRYIPSHLVLIPFLQRAYTLRGGRTSFLDVGVAHVEAEIDFWTHSYSGIEPDVRIMFPEKTAILIEAKYFSGLSSEDPHTNESVTFSESQNQLIRQMRALRDYHPGLRKVSILLTSDGTYPDRIMDRVYKVLDSETIQDVEAYWLSWHAITEVIDRARSQVTNRFAERVVSDLLFYCRDRKHFQRFRGISAILHGGYDRSGPWRFAPVFTLAGPSISSFTTFAQSLRLDVPSGIEIFSQVEGLSVQAEVFDKSKRVASFYFNAVDFFRQLGLLMRGISEELLKMGLVPGHEGYGLRYASRGSDAYQGFQITTGYFGRFYESKVAMEDHTNQTLHFSYGIFFGDTDPSSKLAPWIPLLYFIRGELARAGAWNMWELNDLLVQAWMGSRTEDFVAKLEPKEPHVPVGLRDKLHAATIIVLPLVVLDTTDSVRRVVPKVVDALRNGSADALGEIKDLVVIPQEAVASLQSPES